jgi:hypothetical protein
MHALKPARWLVLLGALGCEGPTLNVGDYLPLDAGPMVELEDAEAHPDARAPVHDAQADGHVEGVVVQRCFDDDDCRDARFPRCNTNFFSCTNCQFDRDCKQGEYCDATPWTWQCRPDDGHHGSGAMGGAP